MKLDDQDKTNVSFAIEEEHEIPGREEVIPDVNIPLEDEDTTIAVKVTVRHS